MAQEESAGQIRGKHARRLPIEFAELLDPPVEHALNHPLRREILRALNHSDGPRSAGEIATQSMPKTGVPLITYHAAVLETCDIVRIAENEPSGQSFARRYASNVANDTQIAAILGATESLDNLGG
jgi:DNA-binding transcriptional ArsR family regulator